MVIIAQCLLSLSVGVYRLFNARARRKMSAVLLDVYGTYPEG